MPSLTAYGNRLAERARALPPPAVDAVIAVVCAVNIVVQATVNGRLSVWVAVTAGVSAVALLWRRAHPFATAGVIGLCTVTLSLNGGLGDLPPAQLIATYTFAALCPPVKRLIAAAATAAGITVSVLVPEDEVLNLGLVGIAFIAAYALGTGARARRDRIAMLEERAARLAEEQAAAATRERERIAREMHDILAHSMSMVVIQAEAGPVAVRSDPDKAEQVFDTISVTAREALAQLRRALGVLRSEEASRRPPPGLDALPALVDGVRNAGLAVTLEQDGEPRPVPADLAVTVYRVVQEALTNTVRHAAAGEARVRLSWHDRTLRVEVGDDGRGPAAPSPDPSAGGAGLGLTGMRERVAASGGELVTGAGPGGKGYRVAATLPLD
ncbi:histidine kinase [Actinomadura viridis]|uniref:Oxygen sensor histidine kinase NreB n=1 Tax=Actinomadura viridis TaxID=58110 RepID=A0A931GKV0_9ACTN|nr:sensor histidine kinase [Actinomadura viridis]MBG6090500.1 signal transduction histidine kinase [Actinomadura viridis]